MTVKTFIELVKELKINEEAILVAFDADSGKLEEVSGLVFNEFSVEIQTDYNS